MKAKDLISRLAEERPNLKVLAVSKGRSVLEIQNLIALTGLTRIAENRLAEALLKFSELPLGLERYFIGKLQSRKIPKIVELFDVIQSVENLEQAKLISECGKPIQIFLQVNLSRRSNRSGVLPEELSDLISAVQSLPHVNLIGLMGMASPIEELGENGVRAEFKLLKSLQGSLDECSMGMSADFEIALEEGSSMIRLGTILFE
jgi:pyridoxal phosphate enzyme (YggS family)